MKRIPWRSLPLLVTGLLAVVLTTAIACKHVPTEQERMAMDRANRYLVKDSTLYTQFAITARGVELFDTNTTNPERAPEAVIYWDEVDLFQKLLYALPTDSM